VEKYCTVGQATDDNLTHMHARWIPKATNTCIDRVIFIAYQLQQWLLKSASNVMLNVHCLTFYVLRKGKE
jgi:hypothetical protein